MKDTNAPQKNDIFIAPLGMNPTLMPINPKLMAQIGEYIEDDDPRWKDEKNAPYTVRCILEDGEFALENQYSSPFEDSNPEGRMPSLMALAQTGQGLTAAFDILQNLGMSKAMLDELKGSKLAETVEGLKGKTSFTKINSQQIFTSSSGVKISGTLVFSAWADAKTEVEDAIQKLQEWATPVYLSDKSLVQNMSEKISLDSLFSSVVPPMVWLSYGGKTYRPLVIESFSAPITAPMNANGDRITVKCQISLLSLKAWDKNNIIALYSR